MERTGASDDDQNEGSIRPVVALKSTTEFVYNINGYWDLSTGSSSSDEDDEEIVAANVVFSYSITNWTNEDIVVTVTLAEELQTYVTNGIYIIQYATESPENEESWSSYSSSGITMSTNGQVYVRLYDGTNGGAYATGNVTNIDKLAPEDFALEYKEITLRTIYVKADTTDKVSTSEYACSGLSYYEFSIDGGKTWETKEKGVNTNVFASLDKATTYSVSVKAVDNAGNETIITESVSTENQAETGDWVEYSIDLNGNNDYTDDWRLLYTNSSGVMFIIAADYLENDSEYFDLDDLEASARSTYGVYWAAAPTKQTISSTTNSLFMASFSGLSSKTYNNIKCVSTLLNTSNWTSFVDSNYANYAIGSPTAEMWIEAWNEKGYTDLYLAEGTYGYYIGTEEDPTSIKVYVNESDGYYDTLFFPHRTTYGSDGTVVNSYWLASPSAYGSGNNYLLSVYYDGFVWANVYNGGSGRLSALRPIVALKSSVSASYNSSTGVWTLSN